MARTLVVDPQKLADAMAQITSGADKITIGGKTYNKNSSVVNRIKTRPQTVRSLLADESPLEGGTPQMPQPQPITTGQGNVQQINLPSDFKSNLVLTLQNILRTKYAQKGSLGLQAQGKAAFEGLATLPETTAATPGFLGLDLSQARRLQDIEGAGLSNLVSGINAALGQRESRIQQLGELAGGVFSEQKQAEKEQTALLAAQQQQDFESQLAFIKLQLDTPVGTTFNIGGQTFEGLKQADQGQVRAIADPTGGIVFYDDAGNIVKQINAFGETTGGSGKTVGIDSLENTRLTSGGASNGAGRLNPSNFTSGFDFGTGKAKDVIKDADGNVVATITSPFGANHADISGEAQHNGIDVKFNEGLVRSFVDGTIVKKGIDPNYGGFVWIQDSQGNVLQYGHVDNEGLEDLEIGQEVNAGDGFIFHETEKSKMGTATGAHTDIRYVGTAGAEDSGKAETGLTDSEVLTVAQQFGININDPKAQKMVLNNYKRYGILPSAELSSDQIKKIDSFAAMADIINQLEDYLSDIPSGTGLGGKAIGLFEKGKGFVGLSPKAKVYENIRTAVAIPLLKAMGESGNLAQKEQANAINLIPGVEFTTEEREAQWEQLKLLLQSAKENIGASNVLGTGGTTSKVQPLGTPGKTAAKSVLPVTTATPKAATLPASKGILANLLKGVQSGKSSGVQKVLNIFNEIQ